MPTGRMSRRRAPASEQLLAVLAAHPDRHVRADTLIAGLLGSDPPPSAERTSVATSPACGPLWAVVSLPAAVDSV